MRPPSWLVIPPPSEWRREGDHVVFEVRLSRFYWLHPGFWWAAFGPRRKP